VNTYFILIIIVMHGTGGGPGADSAFLVPHYAGEYGSKKACEDAGRALIADLPLNDFNKMKRLTPPTFRCMPRAGS
jgi:hypothetical protein